MIQRKRVCDGCGEVIPPGQLYVRTGCHLLHDDPPNQTSSTILAQSESELCMQCAPRFINKRELDALSETAAKRNQR